MNKIGQGSSLLVSTVVPINGKYLFFTFSLVLLYNCPGVVWSTPPLSVLLTYSPYLQLLPQQNDPNQHNNGVTNLDPPT